MALENTENSSDPVDVDSLLESINSPAPERAMTAAETPATPETAPQPPAPQPPTAQQVQEYEFDWKGQKIKAPIDKLTRWASQGYDYSQRMEDFKRQQSELESKYKPYEKYKVIDEYVAKDPQWWAHVEEQYNNRLASEDPYVKRVSAILDERLKPVESLIEQRDAEQAQQKIVKEDTALADEIKSIRTKYSDLDFDTPNGDGQSLEFKVLEHGSKHGFPSFKAAFFDYYQDQLEMRAEARGREAISKDASKRQKLGIAPSVAPRKASDGFEVRGKSYNDIFNEVLEREGLT